MARVYLDTNFFISLMELRDDTDVSTLLAHEVYVSALSIHILYYVNKIKVPNLKINKMISKFHLLSLTDDLIMSALIGPTSDLEDNIELHSSSDASCKFFLTRDEDLLKMKFFGKAAIKSSLS